MNWLTRIFTLVEKLMYTLLQHVSPRAVWPSRRENYLQWWWAAKKVRCGLGAPRGHWEAKRASVRPLAMHHTYVELLSGASA